MIEMMIRALVAERRRYVDDALLTPNDKTAYGFGYTVGYSAGLARAVEVIRQVLDDEDKKEAKR